MLKGTASALLVLLLFGVAFGVALFRPVASSSAPHVPEPAQPYSPQEEQARLTREQETLQAQKARLAQEWENLQEEQARLTQEQDTLQAEKARLAQEWEDLQAEQTRLAQGWEGLQAEQARLAQEWEDLQAERGRLDEGWARLREQGTSLAVQEQQLQGFRRWSVVAVIVSGLLAVPSVLVLVALARQREPVSQPGRPTRMTSVPTFSDNGRDRERVRHHR